MVRIGCVLLVLLVPAIVSANEKEKPKSGYLGIQIKRGEQEGTVVVVLVVANSPADKAGLKSGDQILEINGVKPAGIAATVAVVRSLKPGKKVKLLIERDGKEKTIEAVPGSAE
jgi:S1-C subfamily serine protease